MVNRMTAPHDAPLLAARRRLCAHALMAGAVLVSTDARALMAGLAPDTPVRRLDENSVRSPWSGVGSISAHGGVYTGVLLHARFVLTAAHVVPPDAPDDALFNLNLDGDLTHRLRVKRVFRHPSPRGLGNGIHSGDLALLELAEPAPEQARCYAIAHDAAPEGTELILVGYGASGNADHGPTVPANAALRRVGANRIEGLMRAAESPEPLIYLFRFDAPPSGARQRSTSLGNLRETGLAVGDSGSPAFVQTRTGIVLLGINSFVSQSSAAQHVAFGFGAVSGGQFLAPHRAWIESVLPSADR
jgi:hypothetical protein